MKPLRAILSLAGAVASLVPLLYVRAEDATASIEVIHDVEIGTGGGRMLHAEITRPKQAPKTLMPAVLLIHGGGWVGGSHKTMAPWIHRGAILAAHGYFVASIEYRLSGEAQWPAQIEDCKLGVRWLRANASKYGVDPDHFGCWGGSAGGHLVACLGTMDEPRYEGSGGYAGTSSKVQAVVVYSGPTDFMEEVAHRKDSPSVTKLLGVSPSEDPEKAKDASPISHVRPGDPPFLLVYGEKDTTVPLIHGTAFAKALRDAGDPVKLMIVKNAGHVMSPIRGGPPPEKDEKTLTRDVIAFLDSVLKK